MRRNILAGILLAAGLALMASALPGLGIIHFGSSTSPGSQAIIGISEPLSPQHQHPRFLPGVKDTPSPGSPTTPVAYLTIPSLGITKAPIYDRGIDSKGNMLIARGYAVTHFSLSSSFGGGNAVLYGHDDIEGSVFARLKDLKAGDEIDVLVRDGSSTAYRVSAKTIVAPTAVQILQPTGDVRLTLFTCWPNWVDTQRVVVTAMPAASA